MKRFEYKFEKIPRGSWFSPASMQDALVDFLNREGRDGWRPAPVPANFAGWRLLMEREIVP